MTVSITIDGEVVTVPVGSTILDACREIGNEQPTLCWVSTLTPVNVCRVCVVEVEGARTLVPSCSREVEEGMVIDTDSERVRHSRKMVLEFLDSSADLSQSEMAPWMERYGVDASRYGPPSGPHDDRDRRHPGHHPEPDGSTAETVDQAVKVDNALYIRDYASCILCYKCVQACGEEAQAGGSTPESRPNSIHRSPTPLVSSAATASESAPPERSSSAPNMRCVGPASGTRTSRR